MSRDELLPRLVATAHWRHLLRHGWQLALAILGVALGVGVVVGVNLANHSAQASFERSARALAGHATHRLLGGPEGLDESVYTHLRVELGIRASAPVLEAYGQLADERVHVVGVDPLAEAPLRPWLERSLGTTATDLLTQRKSALIAAPTAKRLGLARGDTVTLALGGQRHRLNIAGRVEAGRRAPAAIEGLVVVDLATAQEVTGRYGQLSHIDLRAPAGTAPQAWERQLRAQLPKGLRLVPIGTQRRAMAQMTRAFRINLTAMSLLALLVGSFLIYNTMSLAVLQRSRTTAILRGLGATPRQVFVAVAREALLVGAIGSVLGLLLGTALAHLLLGLVVQTVNDLYVPLIGGGVIVSPASVVVALILGLGGSLVAALTPAVQAARTPPGFGLQRSRLESVAQGAAARLAAAGLGGSALGLALLTVSHTGVITGFAALFLVVLGLTLTVPWLLAVLARRTAPALGRVLGVQARVAVRGAGAALSRTGVAVAALMLAVSASIGVGLMITSFRASLEQWLYASLPADIYVSIADSGSAAPLPQELVRGLENLTEVAAISTSRSTRLHTLQGPQTIRALGLPRGQPPPYPLKAGDPEGVWPAFRAARGVIVSEPYAFRHDVAVGDVLRLGTDDRGPTAPVLAIHQDYGSDRGVVLVPEPLYRQWFGASGYTSLGLFINPQADLEAVLDTVRRQIGTRARVRANRDIRAHSLAIFERTFAITGVLRTLSIVVAFVAVLGALSALQLERTRELAVLRATGFTPAQIAQTITSQTAFMGAAAGLFAVPTGILLAWLLIHVVNRRSFGWSMEMVIDPTLLGQGLLLAIGAAVSAGVLPAWRMARGSPVAGLREE